MARIPYVDPTTAPQPVREVLAQLPVDLNIFRMMAHAETNLRPLLTLGASVLAEQQLDARLRELAILRVAKMSGAEYEWMQHVPIAEAVGASRADIEALERGDLDAACFDEVTRSVLSFTTEVVRDVGASRECFAQLARHLSSREIVELIVAIGFYMMMARLMESTEIDLDEPLGVAVLASARGANDRE